MNQMQVKHLTLRVEEIRRAKTKPMLPTPHYSYAEQTAMLRRGEYTADPSVMEARGFRQGIEFPAHPRTESVKEENENRALYNVNLKCQATRLQDELIFGDVDEALKILREFESAP